MQTKFCQFACAKSLLKVHRSHLVVICCYTYDSVVINGIAANNSENMISTMGTIYHQMNRPVVPPFSPFDPIVSQIVVSLTQGA